MFGLPQLYDEAVKHTPEVVNVGSSAIRHTHFSLPKLLCGKLPAAVGDSDAVFLYIEIQEVIVGKLCKYKLVYVLDVGDFGWRHMYCAQVPVAQSGDQFVVEARNTQRIANRAQIVDERELSLIVI